MKSGLRQRPTFEGIVDYIANGQETIKYPDRLAKFMRNHPYLTQLDGEGMMEMQEQQENAWKEQLKDQRVKELSKGSKSAPENRTTRDMAIQNDLISNDDFDRAVREADEVIGARSRALSSELRGKRDNINQTIRYRNWEQEGAGDVAHAMDLDAFESPEGSLQPSSKRGRSSSSRPEDPSSSSGGPPPPPPPSTGAKVLSAMKTGGKVTLQAAKLGYDVWRDFSDAMKGPVAAFADAGNRIQGDPWAEGPRDYQGFSYSPPRRPSSTPAQAQQSVAIPKEAPKPRAKSRARKVPSQSRGRSQRPVTLTPSDVQEGITGGSGTRLLRESQAGEHVKRAARAIVTAGRFSRTGKLR